MTTRRKFIPLLVALLGLGGCVNDDSSSGPEPAEPANPVATLDAAIEQAIDGAVLPAVERFLADTRELSAASDAFCATPDQAKLVKMQGTWRATYEQWFRLSMYTFGPLDDDIVFPTFTFIDSLRLRGTNYLDTVRSQILSDINGKQELDSAYYRLSTFQRVGLLALESAIFETSTPEHSKISDEIVAEFNFRPRKCEVLQGLTTQLMERAQSVQQGWLVSYKESGLSYRALFLDGQLDDDGTEPITQLLISGQEFLDYLQSRRVVETGGQISMHAWDAISATIDEVELLLRGNESTSDTLFDVMDATGNQNAVAAVEDSISEVRQAIADRDVAMLEISLGFLDGNFKREIPDSLELDLGINFSDGD
jgi:predicted lipoprotein